MIRTKTALNAHLLGVSRFGLLMTILSKGRCGRDPQCANAVKQSLRNTLKPPSSGCISPFSRIYPAHRIHERNQLPRKFLQCKDEARGKDGMRYGSSKARCENGTHKYTRKTFSLSLPEVSAFSLYSFSE